MANVKLRDLVPFEGPVSDAVALAPAEIREAAAATALRKYEIREDWPTKDGVRKFAAGEFADHRADAVQDLVLWLAENTKLAAPAYAAAANLHCPYMGRLALASARARREKASAEVAVA